MTKGSSEMVSNVATAKIQWEIPRSKRQVEIGIPDEWFLLSFEGFGASQVFVRDLQRVPEGCGVQTWATCNVHDLLTCSLGSQNSYSIP